jgi:uncharacterized protein YaiL (DUF2058 family)
MIIIGDNNIAYDDIKRINTIEDISFTQPNSTIIFNFNFKILKYTQQNDINSAVIVNTIKDVIYVHNLDAKYIVVNKNIAKQVQKIADNYMFDSKILVAIQDENELEQMAIDEIDGVIYLNRILDEK